MIVHIGSNYGIINQLLIFVVIVAWIITLVDKVRKNKQPLDENDIFDLAHMIVTQNEKIKELEKKNTTNSEAKKNTAVSDVKKEGENDAKNYAETDLPKEITRVKEKYRELAKDYNRLVRKSNQNIETLEELEKENKSLKNEIKGIYKGFNQFMENTLGATVGQAKKLMNNLMSEVKEFVKGGEFEKIHRNETKTRDRDELSR